MFVQRKLHAEQNYLNLPVKNDIPKSLVSLKVDGETITEFNIELTEEQPDFWVFIDISRYDGKQMILSVDVPVEAASVLDVIIQSDEIIGADHLYKETYRPQFHFSSRRGRLNDPNGLVYYKGEYHLFYQHNPFGWKGGNLHWGHAVSRDLIHWEELPAALIPRQYLDFCYSGSACIDWHNSTGLQQGSEPVMIAMFTSTGRGECIAYSQDLGRTWEEYAHNPVLVHGKLIHPFDLTDHWKSWFFHPANGELIRPLDPPESQIRHISRDPKVVWHKPTKKWVMVVYEQETYEAKVGENCTFAIYISDNLIDWQLSSIMKGWYECPELFEMCVDANSNDTRWVMYGGDGRYVIGDFDGRTFHFEPRSLDEFDPYTASTKFLTNETYKYMGFYGKSLFAPQTFNDIPAEDGRRIQIGWLKSSMPGMPFNQMMALSCELSLQTTDDGIRLFTQPVREVERLRGKKDEWTNIVVENGEYSLPELTGDTFEIVAECKIEAEEAGLEIRGIKVVYDSMSQILSCENAGDFKVKAPLRPINGMIKLRIFVDRTSIEIFANDGRVYMPLAVIPNESNREMKWLSKAGAMNVSLLEIYPLKSIWS